MYRIIKLLSLTSPIFAKIAIGSTCVLMVQRKIDRHQMRKGLITDADPREAIHKKTGSTDLKETEKIILEHNGELNVTSTDTA
ncbi:MAG: hypothetical protein H7240_03785 [Glaciimonas sp.]|nr:hypothetical protein [Glaciimonas sp.]